MGAVDESIDNIFTSVGEGFTQLGIVFLIIAVYFGAIVWALYDIYKSQMESSKKLLWALVCIILGLPGVLVYWIFGRNRAQQANS